MQVAQGPYCQRSGCIAALTVLSRVVSEMGCHRNNGQWLDSLGMRQECSVCFFLCGAVALEFVNSRLGHFGVVFTVYILAE